MRAAARHTQKHARPSAAHALRLLSPAAAGGGGARAPPPRAMPQLALSATHARLAAGARPRSLCRRSRAALPPRAVAAGPAGDVALPPGVRVLRPPAGASDASPVYLIGTSHCSPSSVADVAALIDALRPRAVCLEACAARLGALLPSAPSRWRFSHVALRGVPERPVPGHPSARALLARLACQPGAAVTPADVAADLQLLLDTGLFADVAADVRGVALSYGAGRDALEAVATADALLLSVTPRTLPAVERYVVALAPELRARYPPDAAVVARAAPALPWLPAFHAAFAALLEEASAQRAGRELTALETCCVAREAVARAGRAWAAEVGAPHGAVAVALRCERDVAHPGTLVLALEPPRARAEGDAPRGGDAWDAAGEAALRADDNYDDVGGGANAASRATAAAAAAAAAAALALPAARRRAPQAAGGWRRRGLLLRSLDAALGAAAWAPAGAAAAALARKLRASPGDDLRAAMRAAAAAGATSVVFVDRRADASLRRAGRAVRKALLRPGNIGTFALAVLTLRACLAAAPLRALGVVFAAAAAALALTWMLLPKRWVAARERTARAEMLARAGAAVPLLPTAAQAALLQERDTVMASALRAVSQRAPLPHAPRLQACCDAAAADAGGGTMPGVRYTLMGSQRAAAEAPPDVLPSSLQAGGSDAVVAVVGAAHVAGIAAAWDAWRVRAELSGAATAGDASAPAAETESIAHGSAMLLMQAQGAE